MQCKEMGKTHFASWQKHMAFQREGKKATTTDGTKENDNSKERQSVRGKDFVDVKQEH